MVTGRLASINMALLLAAVGIKSQHLVRGDIDKSSMFFAFFFNAGSRYEITMHLSVEDRSIRSGEFSSVGPSRHPAVPQNALIVRCRWAAVGGAVTAGRQRSAVRGRCIDLTIS